MLAVPPLELAGGRHRKRSEKKLSDTYSESSSVKGVHKSTSSMEKERGVSPNIYPIDHEIQQFYEEFNSPNPSKLLSTIDEQRSASENHSSRRKDLKFSSGKVEKARNLLLIQNNVFAVSAYEHSQTPRDSGQLHPDELGAHPEEPPGLPAAQQQLVQTLKKAKNPPKIGNAASVSKLKSEELKTEPNKKIKESLRISAGAELGLSRGLEEQTKSYFANPANFYKPDTKTRMTLNIPPAAKSPSIYEQILNSSNPPSNRQPLAAKDSGAKTAEFKPKPKSMQHRDKKQQTACTYSSEMYHH